MGSIFITARRLRSVGDMERLVPWAALVNANAPAHTDESVNVIQDRLLFIL